MSTDNNLVADFVINSIGRSELYNSEKTKNLRQLVETFAVDSSNRKTLFDLSKQDAKGSYEKGVISFLGALNDFKNKNYSWSMIKLYYSTYYNLRAMLILEGFVPLSVWLKSVVEIFVDGNIRFDKNYRSDHKHAVFVLEKKFSNDYTLSNKLDDKHVYSHLLSMREDINYRKRSFSDPNLIDYISEDVANRFELYLNLYIEDEFKTYPFLKGHFPIAFSLLRLLKTKDLILERNAFEVSSFREIIQHQERLSSISMLLNDLLVSKSKFFTAAP